LDRRVRLRADIRVLEREADHKRDIGESMRRSFEKRCGRVETLPRHLDHDDFGSNRSKIMNVIDSNILERDAGGKPLHTFPHPALVSLAD
jgi:hypothetical protein